MKKTNYYLSFAMILALLFTSCSKEETDVSGPDVQDTFQIQFGTLLNDFAKQSKDHLSGDPVECRTADPSYVLVALTDSNNNWVAGKDPTVPNADQDDFIRVNIKNNNGSWETDFSDELGLPAGTYQLEYFIVYSADDQVLWVAPREGGAYAGSVSDPLPLEIVLAAGTKPYIEVDVLCFIPRVEEAFGYIFFDINLITVENNYCIFVNFCDDTTGREYPALFEVDVWSDGFGGDDVVIDGEMNSVSGAGNNFAATVLCFPLAPLGEGEVYYVRVTVLDAGAYDADASDFVEFTITQADIDAQLLATPRYEHIRINCTPPSGDPFCIPTGEGSSSVCNFGCNGRVDGYLSENGVASSDEFIHINTGNFGDTFRLYKNGTTDRIANVRFSFDSNGDLLVKFRNLDGTITAYSIDARLPANSVAARCRDTRCNPTCIHNANFNVKLENDVITQAVLNSGGFFIKISAQQNGCTS